MIGEGDPHPLRLIRIRHKAQKPAQRLADRIVTGEIAIRPLLSEAGDGAIDEFWVERAQGQVLTDYDVKNPPKLPDPTEKEKKDEKAPPSQFTLDTKILKAPVAMPTGLIFERVELASSDDPITEGLVYIHYLPTGYADEAVIHLKQGEKIHWTLAIQPLTGRIDIIDEDRSLEDLNSK